MRVPYILALAFVCLMVQGDKAVVKKLTDETMMSEVAARKVYCVLFHKQSDITMAKDAAKAGATGNLETVMSDVLRYSKGQCE